MASKLSIAGPPKDRKGGGSLGGPTERASMPRRRTSSTTSPVVATVTVWPAASRARASGISGCRCP